MRPIISTAPASITTQQRRPSIPSKTTVVQCASDSSKQQEVTDPSSSETNGRPLSNGNKPQPNTEPTSSPITPSSSTSSVLSKHLESTAGVPITTKPPPAVKKISLLSDSISKFEQNSDGATRPKVSWKCFIKPSASSSKLVINDIGNNKCNEVESSCPPAKNEAIDENNNELKTELNGSPRSVENKSISFEAKITNPKSTPKEESTTSSTVIDSTATEREKFLPENSSTDQQIHKSQSTSVLCATDSETKSADASTPPVKVKKIVKKIIKRTVTKSSDAASSSELPSDTKVVRIVKKKVCKTKTDNNDETTENVIEVPKQISTQSNGFSQIEKVETTSNKPTILANDKLTPDTTAKIDSLTPKIDRAPLTSGPLVVDLKSTNLKKAPLSSSIIQATLSRPHSDSTDIDVDFKYSTISTVPIGRTESRCSWGKLENYPISASLSRDSTLDSLSRESSVLSRPLSPFSTPTTRSPSVLSNYESWQSSRSETSRLMHTSNDRDNFQPNSAIRLEQPAFRLSAQSLSSQPEKNTNDYLSEKIEHFLRRTDHVMRDWKAIDKGDKRTSSISSMNVDPRGAYRSKSVSNIIARGLTLLKDQPSLSRSSSRMSSINQDVFLDCLEDDNRTVVDEAELSEMTAELSEEHSSSNLISERLEAETTERLRLEKEVKEHEAKYRNLQESSEKLEMELICAKSDLNGDLDDDLEGDENGSSAYRMKYERVARELEFTKKRLQTQHEHDLEQLIGLKKQLEKKLADAYEEVEEQRQVVGQWKRKAQKMTNEMNDLRMLLEEQNSRNNLLEKRQRKFDSECQALQDSARQEKQAKERLTREKDVLIAEKFTIEQSLSDVRLELELKEEKYSALQRELEEMTFGGGTEEEIAQLKRQKMELDRRCKEQEEELDEMAGQIQLLEQAKLRLEMSLETMRKDSRKEAQQRDDELEEVRGSSYKKIKSLECQLEQEHEERTLLLREKHELERRLNNLEDQDRADRAAEEHASQKLKRDLRKYKALLRDAQSQLERVKTDSAGKTLIRQLRNQLEDAESARSAAVKARQVAENDLQDVQSMLEEAQRARFDAEDKATAAQRDRTELQAQIDENDEEMAELIKKYSTTVKQLSSEQAIIADYEIKISELETEKKSLKEQISDLTSRLENVENISDSSSSIQLKRLELRTKELESRLEFEQATRARMEIQLNRHKDSIEKAQSEMNQTRNKEIHAQEALKKAQKTIRELREELHSITNKEHESVVKRKDLEKRLESVEAEAASARADLRLALQRIADLQQAMEEGDSYHSDSENSDSSIDSMSELNYCRSSNNSSLRARSGEVNGTSSNGGSTTLCIREEKENTPRIRSKFKGTCLRRRRLPFTIKEEEEEDEVSLDSLHASVEPRERKTIKDDDDDTIGNCIESIRKALIDGAMQSNTELRVPPKHTGAIKKIFQVQSKSNESNLAEEHEGVNIPNNRTDAHCNPTDNLSDSNKQFTSESSTDTDTRKPTNSTEHCSNDDSRFDFEALKSIKEKIKNLNRNLKEEAMQEACSKTDCSNLTARMQSFELSKNESPNTRMSSFDKLDQIDSQLNLDGIRLMKEKIQKMKKKLQEESSSVTKSLSTEEITGEINEMKKTLTAAFISKNVEKDALRQSSSREECSSSMDHNSSSSSIASSIFAPTSSSATLSNLRTKASAADSENIFEKSGSITTTPSNEGGVNANYVNDAADNNNDLLECLPQCSNPIQLAAVLMNAENLPIVSVDTFQKISIATNIAKTEDEEYNVSSSLESEVLVMDNNPELRSSCEMQEYIPLEKDRNTTETIVDQQCNDNDKDSVCEKIESQDETQKVNLEKNATFFPNKYDIQTAYDENLQSEADTAHLEIDENSGNSSQILNKDPECLITEQQEDLCPAPDSADEKPCLLEEFPSRQTSEDISQVCTNSDVQEVNKVSTTCLRNICENTAMCRCENIDQIVIMLTNSMEKVERLPSNFQNKLGNDENNNSNNEKVFLQTGAPGITTNGKYNQDDTDQANVENSVCTEKLEHEKDTKAFMSMPDVYCTIETKIHAQLVSSNEIEEEVNHFKTDNNNETNSQEKVTTGEQNLTKKAFSQFIERCNQDNSDQTKVEDSVCTENLENVLLIVEKDTEVFMLMPGDDSTFKTKNHDQSSQLVSSNEVKEEIKIDNNNNNETSSPEKVTTGEQILTKKVFSNHGSLKRKPKQMDLPDSSIPSPRRSSLQNSSSTKTIYSDLAKGNTLKTAQVSSQLQNAETVDSSLNVTKPIDNITNHVSERTSLVDRTDLLTERSSSCSIVPLYAVAVSIDVTNSNVPSAVGVELPTTDQQKPLTYAESLRKARTPPKTQGVPVRVPSVGTIASRTNATRNGKQQIQQQNQQQRVRHLSLARGGNNQKQASDTIRQSKSASRLSTKPSNSKQTCAKPSVSLSPAPNNACLRRNNTLGAQNLNKSSSNLLQERKQNENTIKSTSKQSKEQINHANSRNRNSTRK
ncbi:repetitive organellar protein isoform X6 [Toxorhynchites rutilus septentrionalis]|uniref:repetitive organellar protein isoform X6 n=1 Tax=Toxorhynchites rutilus septentrionalis TaxID=329112 RepID=UPI002478979E|nr:repetitive organellar protein isoform X6 [Toxorhynchites rutilus septentrionalis]